MSNKRSKYIKTHFKAMQKMKRSKSKVQTLTLKLTSQWGSLNGIGQKWSKEKQTILVGHIECQSPPYVKTAAAPLEALIRHISHLSMHA